MKIISGNIALDLSEDFSVQIEETNPVFNDRGSQSVPCTVPASRRNMAALGFPHRLDAAVSPNVSDKKVTVVDGVYSRSGRLNVTEASRSAGFTFNIGFDNSTAYAAWKERRLPELGSLPSWTPPQMSSGGHVADILEELFRVYQSADPQKSDFAVFPVVVDKVSASVDGKDQVFYETLNVPDFDRKLAIPDKITRVMDGTPTTVSVPHGYAVSPFLRVWRVLELIFDDLGLEIASNPFKEDVELARLVVLNNAADAVCAGRVNYAELLPDVSVSDFMNALWVRFGLVYFVSFDRHSVDLRLIRDIVDDPAGLSIDDFRAGMPTVFFEQPQYVRLSASASIDGAAPAAQRFEEFARGLDIDDVRIGKNVADWRNLGSPEEPDWDGDVKDDYEDDYPEPDPDFPEPPDPDDDRDDDRDYRAARAKKGKSSDFASILAREFVSGSWFLLDPRNNSTRRSSSSFFDWDPKPEGMEALDLVSVDEWVPVGMVSTVGSFTGNSLSDFAPLYLVGSRHFHSYVVGNESENNKEVETPLAFMLAYTAGNRTVGRFSPESETGKPIVMDDGSRPRLTLLFQFKDGLFANFWRRYDEFVRHAVRRVEVETRLPKSMLSLIDILKPVRIDNTRALIDKLSYNLPDGRDVATVVSLRSLACQGDYDIDKEQNIPDFSAAARHLEWSVVDDGFIGIGSAQDLKNGAVANFRANSGYVGHGVSQYDYWDIDSETTVIRTAGRYPQVWQNDPLLPEPSLPGETVSRKYDAWVVYDIFEGHFIEDPDSGRRKLLSKSVAPVGWWQMDAVYSVRLVAQWVDD